MKTHKQRPISREPRMPDKPPSYIEGVTCPACEGWLKPEVAHNSHSRFAEHYICSACGTREAFDGFFWLDNCLARGIRLNLAGQHELAERRKRKGQLAERRKREGQP
jgi:hypothetical protein